MQQPKYMMHQKNTKTYPDTAIQKFTATEDTIANLATKVHGDIALSTLHINEKIEKFVAHFDTAIKNLTTMVSHMHIKETSDKTDIVIQKFITKTSEVHKHIKEKSDTNDIVIKKLISNIGLIGADLDVITKY